MSPDAIPSILTGLPPVADGSRPQPERDAPTQPPSTRMETQIRSPKEPDTPRASSMHPRSGRVRYPVGSGASGAWRALPLPGRRDAHPRAPEPSGLDERYIEKVLRSRGCGVLRRIGGVCLPLAREAKRTRPGRVRGYGFRSDVAWGRRTLSLLADALAQSPRVTTLGLVQTSSSSPTAPPCSTTSAAWSSL
jgi:hypothetical protein